MIAKSVVSVDMIGKYDTYKGSTLKHLYIVSILCSGENMILIKDRHTQYRKELLRACKGKYDTYKGSTR